MSFHPAYSLPDEYRRRVLAALSYLSVAEAARQFNLATSTIYLWRKHLG